MSIKEREVVIGVNGEQIVEEPFFYDLYPDELEMDAEKAASATVFELRMYLLPVLMWHFHKKGWYVGSDMSIRVKPDSSRPITPDVMVCPVAFTPETKPKRFRTYNLYEQNRPVPFIVFEFPSEGNWQEDLYEKPQQYLELGVKEYFVYDPHDPLYVPDGKKLRGWQYDEKQMYEILPNTQGWLWSNQLNCWLVPDDLLLRLYDSNLNLCLTEEGTRIQEAKRRTAAAKRAEEFQKVDLDEVATAKKELEALRQKLREIGIDPDSL